MKNKTTQIGASLCAVLLASGTASAAVIGVDATSAGGLYDGAGVLDTSSRTWVDASFGSFTLGSDAVSINMGGADSAFGGTARELTGGIDLFNYIRGTRFVDSNFTVTLSGLSDALTYNIVAFGADRFLDRGSKYTVGGVAKSTTGDQTTSFAEGVNYVRFNGVSTNGSGVLTIDVSSSGEGVIQINGFEIQAVPEPGSLALLAMGGVLIARRRRRGA